MYDEIVRRATKEVRALSQGYCLGPCRVDVESMVTPPQLEMVRDLVQDAINHGAQAVVGGNISQNQNGCARVLRSPTRTLTHSPTRSRPPTHTM